MIAKIRCQLCGYRVDNYGKLQNHIHSTHRKQLTLKTIKEPEYSRKI
jgi:hypothetical protein